MTGLPFEVAKAASRREVMKNETCWWLLSLKHIAAISPANDTTRRMVAKFFSYMISSTPIMTEFSIFPSCCTAMYGNLPQRKGIY